MANLTEAAASGDRLQTLKELRGLLAERLEQSNSDRDIASMSKRLMDVTETIEALEQKKADAEAKKQKKIAADEKKRAEKKALAEANKNLKELRKIQVTPKAE